MKRMFINICSIVLTAAAALCMLSGCDNNSSSDVEATTAAPTQAESTAKAEESIKDVTKLHSFDTVNGDELAGAWSITDGEGSDLDSFVYIFNGSGKANLVTGTAGYLSTYTIDEKKKEFASQLMFGINGSYTYEIVDNSTVVLTNSDSRKTTTLTRIDSFDMVPVPDGKSKIDEDILGAWKSENGNYYYFDKNGIMYENSFFMMFTYYTYSAENGVIHAVSNMGSGEEKTDFEYSLKDGKLTIDGYEYTKISISELV